MKRDRLTRNIVPSARWLAGGGTKRSAEFEESYGVKNVERDADCAEPNAAYYDLDGEQHQVEVPEGQGNYVMSLIEEGEWDKLDELKVKV